MCAWLDCSVACPDNIIIIAIPLFKNLYYISTNIISKTLMNNWLLSNFITSCSCFKFCFAQTCNLYRPKTVSYNISSRLEAALVIFMRCFIAQTIESGLSYFFIHHWQNGLSVFLEIFRTKDSRDSEVVCHPAHLGVN